jgi:hypothetical protein
MFGHVDNWYMGSKPIEIDTLEDIKERVVDELSGSYKLRGPNGESVTVRLEKGVLIVEHVPIYGEV